MLQVLEGKVASKGEKQQQQGTHRAQPLPGATSSYPFQQKQQPGSVAAAQQQMPQPQQEPHSQWAPKSSSDASIKQQEPAAPSAGPGYVPAMPADIVQQKREQPPPPPQQQTAAYQQAPYLNPVYGTAGQPVVMQQPLGSGQQPGGAMQQPAMATRVVYQQAVYQTPHGLVYTTIPVVQAVPPPMVLQQQQQAMMLPQQQPMMMNQQQQAQQQPSVAATAQAQVPIYHPGPIAIATASPAAVAAEPAKAAALAPPKRERNHSGQSWSSFSVFTGEVREMLTHKSERA